MRLRKIMSSFISLMIVTFSFNSMGIASQKGGGISSGPVKRHLIVRALDPNGRPIAGVLIMIRPADQLSPSDFLTLTPSAFPKKAKTDSSGVFSWEDLQAKTYSLVGRATGYQVVQIPLIRLNDEGITRLELQFKPGRRITGKIQGSDGAPVSGIAIMATSLEEPGFHDIATSQPDGSFMFDLAPGKYRLMMASLERNWSKVIESVTAGDPPLKVEASYSGGQTTSPQSFSPEGDKPATRNLPIDSGCQIQGQVREAKTGQPIREFEITIQSLQPVWKKPKLWSSDRRQSFHDTEGSFTLTDLPPLHYRVEVRAPGFSPVQSAEFQLKDQEIKRLAFSLEPSDQGILYGRVWAQDTGRPVSGATVCLLRHRDPNLEVTEMVIDLTAPPKAMTDKDGQFYFAGLEPKTYAIMVEMPGFAPAGGFPPAKEILVSVPEKASVEIFLPNGGSIEGLVRSATGFGIAGAYVAAARRSATTDSSGYYRLDNLAEGEYDLSAELFGYGRVNKRSEPPPLPI